MLNGMEKIPTIPKTGSEKNENSVSEQELDVLIAFMDGAESSSSETYNEIKENPAWFIGDGHLRNGNAFTNYLGR